MIISKETFDSEEFKKQSLENERSKLIEEINNNLKRPIPTLCFELWGYSKRDVIDSVLEEYRNAGWSIDAHIFFSFSWRVDIKFKL